MPHAMITGAARRVGRHLALFLAKQGYNITLHYHSSAAEACDIAREIEAAGQSCFPVSADLSDAGCLHDLIKNSMDALGHIDLLIHNASLFEKDTLQDISQAALLAHLQVNMIAPVLLSAAYKQHFTYEKQGHIICLLDGMNGWSISSEFLSYSLSKLALEQFITLSAPAFAPSIRINGIAPGATLPGHMDKEHTFEKTRALAPLKCNSSPDEVAHAVWMLHHSPSVTGQVIRLSGGMHLLPDHALRGGL